ncbi:MAG: mechanosensitive ion channel/cyclic nucleotide-binding protein [Myxococcaceae bacterium]|nr:mechanosensitive ion channel/cyclic nucleotide-binding protein [Myxococcaceae bacterium]
MNFFQGYFLLGLGAVAWAFVVGARAFTRDEQLKKDLRGSIYLFTFFLALRLLGAGVEEHLPKNVGTALRVGWMLAFAFGSVRTLVSVGLWVFRQMRRAPTSKIVRDLTDFVLYIAVTIPILKTQLAIDVTTLLGTSAVVSLVLGLALQDTLGNLFAGLAVQLEKPFDVGDFITVGQHSGQVVEIAWRATRIETFRKEQITLPNSMIAKEAVKNFSRGGNAVAIDLVFGVTYSAPPNQVKQEVLEALKAIPQVLADPPPQVHTQDFAESSVQYLIRYYLRSYADVLGSQGEIYTRLWYRFGRAGIEIPFPQRIITVRNEPQRAHVHQALLQELDLFAPFTEAERMEIATHARERHFGRGEHVINEGEEGHTFFVVTRGSLAVMAGKARTEVARLGRGQYFGEMSLLTGEPRSATVTAHEDSVLLELDREAFGRHFAEHEGLAQKLAEVLASRKIELQDKVNLAALAPGVKANDILARLKHIFRVHE